MKRNSLFTVGMCGGAPWNASIKAWEEKGMFCTNFVILFPGRGLRGRRGEVARK